MYEKFKLVKTQEEFFNEWKADEVKKLDKSMRDEIYKRYFVKCVVFQRDNFICQNEDCDKSGSRITLHHIKFQKNDGKDSLKNCITICHRCHAAFHKGKISLTFWGATYKIHQDVKINWKQMKKQLRDLRRMNKDQHGIMISMDMLRVLMRFLDIDMSHLYDDEEGDD